MILDNCQQFLDKISQKISQLGIDVSSYYLDHFGYQASSDTDYDQLKPQFEKLGQLVSEEIVGGRRVGIIKLHAPIVYNNSPIPAIEIVAPKQNQICPSALNHIEYVIDEDFETFTAKYPNLPWDKSKINQPMFPMVTLQLDEDLQVKFHYKPVLDIIRDKI